MSDLNCAVVKGRWRFGKLRYREDSLDVLGVGKLRKMFVPRLYFPFFWRFHGIHRRSDPGFVRGGFRKVFKYLSGRVARLGFVGDFGGLRLLRDLWLVSSGRVGFCALLLGCVGSGAFEVEEEVLEFVCYWFGTRGFGLVESVGVGGVSGDGFPVVGWLAVKSGMGRLGVFSGEGMSVVDKFFGQFRFGERACGVPYMLSGVWSKVRYLRYFRELGASVLGRMGLFGGRLRSWYFGVGWGRRVEGLFGFLRRAFLEGERWFATKGFLGAFFSDVFSSFSSRVGWKLLRSVSVRSRDLSFGRGLVGGFGCLGLLLFLVGGSLEWEGRLAWYGSSFFSSGVWMELFRFPLWVLPRRVGGSFWWCRFLRGRFLVSTEQSGCRAVSEGSWKLFFEGFRKVGVGVGVPSTSRKGVFSIVGALRSLHASPFGVNLFGDDWRSYEHRRWCWGDVGLVSRVRYEPSLVFVLRYFFLFFVRLGMQPWKRSLAFGDWFNLLAGGLFRRYRWRGWFWLLNVMRSQVTSRLGLCHLKRRLVLLLCVTRRNLFYRMLAYKLGASGRLCRRWFGEGGSLRFFAQKVSLAFHFFNKAARELLVRLKRLFGRGECEVVVQLRRGSRVRGLRVLLRSLLYPRIGRVMWLRVRYLRGHNGLRVRAQRYR